MTTHEHDAMTSIDVSRIQDLASALNNLQYAQSRARALDRLEQRLAAKVAKLQKLLGRNDAE